MVTSALDLPPVDMDFVDESVVGVHQLLADLRSQRPIWRTRLFGDPAILLLSYDAVLAGFRDEATLPAAPGYMDSSVPAMGRMVLAMDGEEHRVHRAMLSAPFRARVVPRYAALIRQAAEDLIDPLVAAGQADLVSAFTKRFPLRVISAMLGLPEGHERDDEMAQWALALIRYPWGPEAALEARAKFTAMVDPLIEERRREPRQDLISLLVHAEIDGERLDDEAIRTFIRFLFPAGADTTYMGLGNVLCALVNDPDLMDLARREPDRRGAIMEEGLRWDSPIANLPRMVSPDHDVEWNGLTLPAGVRLIYSVMSANRDPAAFSDPARFDPDRSFDKSPITFGFGTHFCIGNHLALLEMTTALDVLLERMPDLRLQAGATAQVVGTILRGPDALPVCWSAR